MNLRERIIVTLLILTICIGLLYSSCEERYDSRDWGYEDILGCGYLETPKDTLVFHAYSQKLAYDYFMVYYNPDLRYYRIYCSEMLLDSTRIVKISDNNYNVKSYLYIKDMEPDGKVYRIDYNANVRYVIPSDEDRDAGADPYLVITKCSFPSVESFRKVPSGYMMVDRDNEYFSFPHQSIEDKRMEYEAEVYGEQ